MFELNFNFKKNVDNLNFEICISDNNSDQSTEEVIRKYDQQLKIRFNKNEKNLGFAINGIKTVSMAEGVATIYRASKKKKKQNGGWGLAAQIFLVLGAINIFFQYIKVFVS